MLEVPGGRPLLLLREGGRRLPVLEAVFVRYLPTAAPPTKALCPTRQPQKSSYSSSELSELMSQSSRHFATTRRSGTGGSPAAAGTVRGGELPLATCVDATHSRRSSSMMRKLSPAVLSRRSGWPSYELSASVVAISVPRTPGDGDRVEDFAASARRSAPPWSLCVCGEPKEEPVGGYLSRSFLGG